MSSPRVLYGVMQLLPLLLAGVSGKAMSLYNQTCPYQEECSASINLQHIEKMERYVNQQQDPCEDFHGYACGNWQQLHGEHDSAMSLSGKRINNRYENLFESMLKQPKAQLTGKPLYAKLVRYYQSCKSLNKPRLRRYLEMLPTPKTTEWWDLLTLLGRYGYQEHFVKIEVTPHNISQHIILIQPHNHNAKWNFSLSIYNALRRHLHQQQLPHFHQLKNQFLHLEQDLFNVIKTAIADDNLQTYSLEQLIRELPEVDWTTALGQQLGRNVEPQHRLLIEDLAAIKSVIKYLNEADAMLLKLYNLARFLHYLLKLSHNPLDNLEDTSVNSSCIQHMRKALYLPMNYAYEQSFYHQERAQDELVIHRVFEELKLEFSKTLERNDFNVKKELLPPLLSKIQGLRLNVGNMPRNVDEQFFWEFDEHWQVGRDFYENHLNSLLQYNSHLSSLEASRNKTQKDVWYSFNYHGPEMSDNIDATPYFFCLGSIIIIPFAYVQLPFYNFQFWPALLYGDLANTLGHEMLHSFDTYFVDYDAQGNLRAYSEELLLNPSYVSSINCLNDTTVETFNERTSDISGSRLALQTYLRDSQQRLQNGRLYFLQFAQFFCGEKGDHTHDVGSKRLNYALAQMPEFAEVFQCTPGQAMSPLRRCNFW